MAVNRQSGSALLFLFIAVALFAAISYAFMQGSRNNLTMITSEKAKAAATGSQDCSNAVSMAGKRLAMRGCTVAQISSDTTGAVGAGPTDGSCAIYHPNGGGVKACSGVVVPVIPSAKKVFVSSTTYKGNLGGVAGADAKCAARATAGGLTGTFKAWIADTTAGSAPAIRFTQSTGPYELINGARIADNWGDLVDGTLQAKITLTELGTSYLGLSVSTNVKFDGTVNVTTGGNACNNWSSNVGMTCVMGYTGFQTGQWTDHAAAATCNAFNPLYCFEQ